MSQDILNAARTAALSELEKVLVQTKANFLSLFGDWVRPEDLKRITWLFEAAAAAKASQFSARSPEEAQDLSEEYDAYMKGIETIGNKYVIQGEAKAGLLLRSTAHMAISGFFAVAGAVLQAALSVVIPGVGGLVGAGVNAGLQYVVRKFLGD